jgi:hypothetical protein
MGSTVSGAPGKSSPRAGFSIIALAIAFCLSSAAQAQQSDATSVSLKAHPGWVQVPGGVDPSGLRT